jgi:ferrous iron transport protein A
MRSTSTTENGKSLSTVPRGESVQIRSLNGGHEFLSRLASLGFTPRAHIRVVQNYGHGPIIVALRGTRVALGRGEARKIIIEPLAGKDDGG